VLFELLPDGLTRVTTARECSALHAVLGLWYKNNNTVSIHVDCNKAKLARSNQAKATLAIGDRSCEESQSAHPGHGEKPIFCANIFTTYASVCRGWKVVCTCVALALLAFALQALG